MVSIIYKFILNLKAASELFLISAFSKTWWHYPNLNKYIYTFIKSCIYIQPKILKLLFFYVYSTFITFNPIKYSKLEFFKMILYSVRFASLNRLSINLSYLIMLAY